MLFYLTIACFALVRFGTYPNPKLNSNNLKFNSLKWYAVLLVVIVFIGFRIEVGGDWYSYHASLLAAGTSETSLSSMLVKGPAYRALEMIGSQYFGGIYLVNTVCASVFSIGLISFCRNQPRPWLALTIATPIAIIVVAMGYTRQSVALGFFFFALSSFQNGRNKLFLLNILAGSLFHLSLLPLAVIGVSYRFQHYRVYSVFVFLSVIAVLTVLSEGIHKYVDRVYLIREYESAGGLIRMIMNLIPASIFIFFRRRMLLSQSSFVLCSNMSLLTFTLAILLIISPSSALVDRFSVYLIPFQIMILCLLPDLFKNELKVRLIINFSLVVLYGLVLYVWLNFAHNAIDWLPYKNLLFNAHF